MTTSPDRRGGASRDVVSSRGPGRSPGRNFCLYSAFFKTKRVPRRRSVPHSKALVVETCTNLGTEVVKQCSGAKDGPWRAGTGRAGVRARAAAHAGRAGGGAPCLGRAGRAIAHPACTAVKYAGLEPGAHQLSCKPAALRAQARSPPPHWSRKLRLSEKCQTLSAHGQWSVSLCTARAGHEARAMRGQPGCRMPTFDRAAAILTWRLQRMPACFLFAPL